MWKFWYERHSILVHLGAKLNLALVDMLKVLKWVWPSMGWYKLESSLFKPPHRLQTRTENLLNIKSLVHKTTNSWPTLALNLKEELSCTKTKLAKSAEEINTSVMKSMKIHSHDLALFLVAYRDYWLLNCHGHGHCTLHSIIVPKLTPKQTSVVPYS